MAPVAISALFLALIHQAYGHSSCVPSPVVVPVANITLSNGKISRGLSLAIGTPPQQFAVIPQWPLNNTYVFGGTGYCNAINQGWSDTGCLTLRGGIYNAAASTSRQTIGSSASPSDASPFNQMTYVSDIMKLNSDVSLGNITIGVAQNDLGQQGYHPQTALGLGPNSTVLAALKKSGRIAANAYSFFWGRTGANSNSQWDGNFVFGGYDRAKTTGQKFTSSLTYTNQACSSGMIVTIIDMQLNFPNGTSASMFPAAKTTAMSACIFPDFPALMTLPLDPYFDNFQTLTNTAISNRTAGQNFFNMLYDSKSMPYQGDLTLKFPSGMSVRIPNDQLVVPDAQVDKRSGSRTVNSTNNGALVFNVIQDVNKNDMSILGRTFLSAVYLHVNQDAGQFTLWNANPTSKSDMVGVTAAGEDSTSFCRDSNTSSSPATTNGGDSGSGPGLNGGAIAGIVIGVLALLAIAAFGIWFWRRRKVAGADGRGGYTSPIKGPGAAAGAAAIATPPMNTWSHYSQQPSSYQSPDLGSYYAPKPSPGQETWVSQSVGQHSSIYEMPTPYERGGNRYELA